MTAVVEAVGGLVGNIRVHYGDRDQSFALIEDLDVEASGELADARVDKFSGLHGTAAKREAHFGDGIEIGENVGDKVHLSDALHNKETPVGAPLAIREVAVYRTVHVPWFAINLTLCIRYSQNSVNSERRTFAIFKSLLD